MITSRFRQGMTSIPSMMVGIVTDLISGGMILDSAYSNGSLVTSPSDSVNRYVLKASDTTDPLFEDQEWRLVIHVDETSYDYFLCTKLQVTEDGDVAATGEFSKSGALVKDNDLEESSFFSRSVDSATWSVYETLPEGATLEGIPISSRVSVGDHGIFIATWAEGQDNKGNCFNWVLVQRPVLDSGQVLVDGKAPLFCVFSRDGGGSNTLDAINPDGILKFVVCESDVGAPSKPVSAVIPTPDSNPILNPIQQVAIAETFEYVINFPKGLNTHRYYYEASLDMIATTSADVLSSSSTDQVTVFNEGSPREYLALNSNYQNNRGMRLLVQI